MDQDREFESLLMNIRGNMGSVTQTIYATNMLTLKLIQFMLRMAKRGILSIQSKDNMEKFAKMTEGKFQIYNVPVSLSDQEKFKKLEKMQLAVEQEPDKTKKAALKKELDQFQKELDGESIRQQLKDAGIKKCCILPKIDENTGTLQVAVSSKDDPIFKNWYRSHILETMNGGKKELKDLNVFTEGNYTIFNLPFEGEKLTEACKDYDVLQINYSMLPDLSVGNDNSQVVIANRDRDKFMAWVKLYREEMIKNGEEPKEIYEMSQSSYLDTGATSPTEYIENAEPEYQEANQEFVQNEVEMKAPVIRTDNCEEYARLDHDDNYEKVTINKDTLVDSMFKLPAAREMEQKGYFASRVPGTWGKTQEIMLLPNDRVFRTDNGKTYVGFIKKNEQTMFVGPDNKITQCNYSGAIGAYDEVERNLNHVKAMQQAKQASPRSQIQKSSTPQIKQPTINK